MLSGKMRVLLLALLLAQLFWLGGMPARADDANRFAGLNMLVEGRGDMAGPTLEQIFEAIDRMTSHGGPGFVILGGRDKDYAQTAGGDGSYIVEWREYSNRGFRHWIAGYRNQPTDPMIKIPTNGAYVEGHRNEKLSAEDVKALLSAFARGRKRPGRFAWRDMTDRF